jgi:hypothetical protein
MRCNVRGRVLHDTPLYARRGKPFYVRPSNASAAPDLHHRELTLRDQLVNLAAAQPQHRAGLVNRSEVRVRAMRWEGMLVGIARAVGHVTALCSPCGRGQREGFCCTFCPSRSDPRDPSERGTSPCSGATIAQTQVFCHSRGKGAVNWDRPRGSLFLHAG